MSETLKALKTVIGGLSDESLFDLKKYVDVLCAGRKGAEWFEKPESAVALDVLMAKAEELAKSAGRKKGGDGSFMREIAKVDLEALAAGRGWHACPGTFAKSVDVRGCVIRRKGKDGEIEVYSDGELLARPVPQFGGRFEHVNDHKDAAALWAVAKLFYDEDILQR